MKKTTLPSLHEAVAIDPTQVKDFREKGHTLTRGILQPEEVTAYRDVINEAAYKYNTETRKLADRDTRRCDRGVVHT